MSSHASSSAGHSSFGGHPCFDSAVRETVGRLHLPVASRANYKLRCSTNHLSGPALSPEEALAWMRKVLEDGADVGMVGITGPGDPLATPEQTLRTLGMVRQEYPDMPLCLTTIGLGGEEIAPELAKLGLSHVTMLVDAVSSDVVEGIYTWIRPGRRTLPLFEAAGELVAAQRRALEAFRKAGLTVKVNTTVYPGCNENHVEDVAMIVAGLGADIMSVQYCTVPGHDESAEPDDPSLLAGVREQAGRHMRLTALRQECGQVVPDFSSEDIASGDVPMPKPVPGRPNVAVASSDGVHVDLHLGHAVRIMVYGPREDGLVCLLEAREAPEPGGGDKRWKDLANGLQDCFVLLVASAGQKPRTTLAAMGLPLKTVEGEIESVVDELYGGKRKKGRR